MLNIYRERITIIHEGGHEILPWHHKLCFTTRGKDIDPATHKLIEREAFLAGSEVMYPLKHFVDDSLSLPLSLKSINLLADRYIGSFEATGIRYALTNQNIMAIVVVKENVQTNEQITLVHHHNNGQYVIPNLPPYKKIIPASTAPLRVQYCSRSYLFSKFIKSGTEIESDNIIYKCWSQQSNTEGEIPASVFGSSNKVKYSAECIYSYGKVFVLLSLPKRQIEFNMGAN